MLPTVMLWIFFSVTSIILHEVFPIFFILFCNCILFKFIGISEHTEIAILMSNSVVTSFVSGQNIKSVTEKLLVKLL